MNKYYIGKLRTITLLIIIFMFFLPISRKYGYKAYVNDDGPKLTSSGTTWKSVCESGQTTFSQINPSTGTNFKLQDFKINEDYGWYEWFYNNVNYVVVGAATLEGLEDVPNSNYSFVQKRDNIHYFHYGTSQNDWKFSNFEFTIDDDNGKSKSFNAIVLDTYIQALDPSNEKWNGYKINGEECKAKSKNTQWIKFYVSSDYKDKYEKLENATLQMTSEGIYPSSAGTTKSEKKRNMFTEFFTNLFTWIGDACQMLLNLDLKVKLTYKRSDIQADKSLNDLIQLEDSSSTNDEEENSSKYKTIKTVNLSKTTENKKGQTATAYTKETEIPVIPTDLYSFCIGDVDLLDVNFFDTNTTNSDKVWKGIRNFIGSAKNVVTYIVAAIIIALIIWRAIIYVLSTISDNPESGTKSKKIINNIVKSILIIGIIYFIMIIITYFYNEVLKAYLNGNESIYLIRVNVDEVYSFNTNIVGLLKYRALSADSDAAFGYAFWYMVVSGATVVGYGLMLARMIFMAFLTICAPFTAAYEMTENVKDKKTENIFNFKNFLKTYTILTFLPFVVILLLRIGIRLS